MERLDINSAPERASIEASIHFARYSVAAPFVKGKRVLDIACGEGYGSFLLKQAGASEVVGVDVFADSVNRATRSFGGPGIEFVTADATTIDERFPAEHFDVIVSCETIEHIEDPAAFLQALKRIAKPDAVIIISCPNDHWYFPEAHQRNPYHLRKYRLEEFQQLAVGVLGDNVNWSIGTAVFGFGSTSLDIERDYQAVPDSWMKFSPAQGAYLVSGGEKPEFNGENCSYYFGIWNAPEITNGAAVFPVSMDAYARMVQAMEGTLLAEERLKNDASEEEANLRKAELRRTTLNYQAALRENELVKEQLRALNAEMLREIDGSEDEANTCKAELRRTRLNYQATLRENELVKERLQALSADMLRMQTEIAKMQVGYNRYLRLGGLVPRPVRALLKKAYRMIRGNIHQ